MTIKGGSGKTDPTTGLSGDDLARLKALMGPQTASGGAGRVYMGMAPAKPPKAPVGPPAGGWIQGPPPPMAAPAPEGGWLQGPGPGRAGPKPRWLSEDDADAEYFTWTQKQRDDFRAKGLLSGLLTQGAGDLEAYSLWQNLVKQASGYGAKGRQVSPLDILSSYVKNNSKGGWIKDGDFEVNPLTGERRYIGPKFKTTTQTAADLTDPATARAIATSVFQDLLGRDPGQGEIAGYAEALAASEQEHPSTTTTTTQYDEKTGEAVGSSSVTAGGMTDQGRQLIAEDKIKQGKEYGAVQAATTYMQALQQAVGGGS